MVRPLLNNPVDSERSLGDDGENPLDDYLETIALLQEEVARLEHELETRDERRPDTAPCGDASSLFECETASAHGDLAGAAAEVDRLKVELAGRDETIGLLLDEVSKAEEVQAATAAEWEHLAEWVTALEQRVEGRDGSALCELENRLAAQEQKANALEVKSAEDRRAWEAQRQIYQAEIARLQGTMDEVAASRVSLEAHEVRPDHDCAASSSALESLQAENLRLRAAWEALVERTTAATERAESGDVRLAQALHERNQLRHQLEEIEDERKRERLEYDATVAELQSRLSQAALAKPAEPATQKKPDGIPSELDIELRVRAMRHHFQEIHEREKEERRQKQLITRLSRLWTRTGPR